MSLLTIITGYDKEKICELFGSVERSLDTHWTEIQDIKRQLATIKTWKEISDGIRLSDRAVNSKFEALERRMGVLKNETESLQRQLDIARSKNNINVVVDNSCLQKQIDDLKKMIMEK